MSIHERLLRATQVLEHCAGHLSAADVAAAEGEMREVAYRPLTKHAIDAATDLRKLLEESGGGEPTDANVGPTAGLYSIPQMKR